MSQFPLTYTRVSCPICNGKGEVPVTPPASTESKSLGEIYDVAAYGEDRGASALTGLGYDLKDHLRGLQAVASAVCLLRYKGEIEEWKRKNAWQVGELERLRAPLLQNCDRYEEALGKAEAEISRLTLLCNENAVLAVEREAENARKDAVIEEIKKAAQEPLCLLANLHLTRPQWKTPEIEQCAGDGLREIARLAQKGKS